MAMLVRFLLSVFVGAAIGFVLMLTGESLFILLTAGLTGLLVGGVVYGIAGSRKGLGGLAGLAVGILMTFLYAELLGYINEEVESAIIAMSVFVAPYVVATFLFSLARANHDEKTE